MTEREGSYEKALVEHEQAIMERRDRAGKIDVITVRRRRVRRSTNVLEMLQRQNGTRDDAVAVAIYFFFFFGTV